MSITQQQYARAQNDGGAARRAGRPITACPQYGPGTDGESLREAWTAEHEAEDARIKARARAVA